MLLVDSVFVNNGGGLVLLKYLVNYLESSNINVFYLFDERVKGNFNNISDSRKIYLSSSLIERHLFYKKNKNKFTKVICFGNLPPTIRLKSKVLVYFHQKLFLKIPSDSSVLNKLILKLKQCILIYLKIMLIFGWCKVKLYKKNFQKNI